MSHLVTFTTLNDIFRSCWGLLEREREASGRGWDGMREKDREEGRGRGVLGGQEGGRDREEERGRERGGERETGW
jgi:hypothetical protein